MAQEAAVPSGMWARIQKMIDDSIARYARSGALRNASISGGAGLTVGAGSKLVVQHPDGGTLMLLGAYDKTDTFNMPDGSRQPMALLYRADGTLALGMLDSDPNTGGFQQFLAHYDRSGNIAFSDDTFSGQGVARPYVPGPFYPARYADMTVGTTSSTFETLWQATIYKQHPRQTVAFAATMDTTGTTGEVQVLVNGVQLGTTQTIGFAVGQYVCGPGAVAGAHMSTMLVEIQARRTTATGTCKVVPTYGYGMQS